MLLSSTDNSVLHFYVKVGYTEYGPYPTPEQAYAAAAHIPLGEGQSVQLVTKTIGGNQVLCG